MRRHKQTYQARRAEAEALCELIDTARYRLGRIGALCEHCERHFIPERKQRYCGPACASAARSARYRANNGA